MSLISQIRDDSKKALLKGDSKRLQTLRFLISLVEKKELSKEVGKMTEGDVLSALQGEMKKKKESRDMFSKAERDDLATEVEEEMKILSTYLPKELSNEEVEKVVKKVVLEMGQGAVFGAVMGKVMAETKGRVGGDKVVEVVKKVLAK